MKRAKSPGASKSRAERYVRWLHRVINLIELFIPTVVLAALGWNIWAALAFNAVTAIVVVAFVWWRVRIVRRRRAE